MKKSIAVFLATAGLAVASRLLGIWWAGKRRFYHREPTAAQLDLLLAQ